MTSPTPPTSAPESAYSSPFGIAWYFLYGYSGAPAAKFLPVVRELGASFTKVYLFWQQLEPEKGRYDWSAVDAFVEQLRAPAEGLISLFSASLWATEKPSALLPPSAAKNLDDYYRFVFELVKRCRGRVRYWENDAEPNNPVFWAGTRERFVTQLRVFHRAVKDADPSALVIAGGYDGLFLPPGYVPPAGHRAVPFPHQEHGLQFFDYVLKEGADCYDIFDLRLYGDPYTIPARVDYIRRRMRNFGYERPILCAEYGGPSLFEFPENRKYASLISAWTQAVTTVDANGMPSTTPAVQHPIAQLYAQMDTLAPQTQMFMQGCSPDLEAKYQRIQSRSLVMRNILALSAGVQRSLYWELLHAPGPRDDLMTLMFGKVGLVAMQNGELKNRTLSADCFAHMATTLAGAQSAERVELAEFPNIYLFQVNLGSRGQGYVVWERRDIFSGEDFPSTPCSWPCELAVVRASDAFGAPVPLDLTMGRLGIKVANTPIYITPAA